MHLAPWFDSQCQCGNRLENHRSAGQAQARGLIWGMYSPLVYIVLAIVHLVLPKRDDLMLMNAPGVRKRGVSPQTQTPPTL